jgi:hypothetical protein
MSKFGRVYSLKVEIDKGGLPGSGVLLPRFQPGGYVEIALPLTVEFEISRASFGASQTGTFRLLNLNQETRNSIQKDWFQSELRAIQFRAGYQSESGGLLPLCFNGTVLTAYSYRRGVDYVTEIDAYDGGWNMVYGDTFTLTQAAGMTARDTLLQLSRLLPYQVGNAIIGNFPVVNKRGEVLFGNIWDLIQMKSNGLGFIDNGQVKALNYQEVISGMLPVISADTGLLGVPKRTRTTLEFDMIFEPRFLVGQVVKLESENPLLNRPWKVIGFEHRGTISAAVAGDCRTSVTLWFTPQDFVPVSGASVT